MAGTPTVTWHGLPQLLRRFDRAHSITDTLYQQAGKAWGERVVAAVRGQQASSRMAASVRADVDARRVEVTLGRSGIPFTGWMEFGGSRYKPGTSRRARRQSYATLGRLTRAARPYVKGGRSLYPTLSNMRPEGLRQFTMKTIKAADEIAGG